MSSYPRLGLHMAALFVQRRIERLCGVDVGVYDMFGYVTEGDRVILRRKGHDDVDVTNRIVKITFEGPRASGKSTIMRAIKERLLPHAHVIEPHRSVGRIEEHALIVEMNDETLERLRG